MTQNDIALGRVVISKAGRDKGRPFLIAGIADENHVFISDGVTHRMSRPKKKKLMHLKVVEAKAETVSVALRAMKNVSDAQVREALAELGYGTEQEKQEG